MNFITKRVQSFKLYQRFWSLGLDFVKSLRSPKRNGVYSANLFGKRILYTDRFWFLHSVEELFLQKVYLFSSEKSAPLILDCGANIGLSVLYFKKIFPQSKIIAFEPDPKNFELLKQNTASVSSNIDFLNLAVWKEQATLTFSSSGNVGSRVVSKNDAGPADVINVGAVPLRDYLQSAEVDFLKIDIEGAEYDVLVSCADCLTNVRNIFIEYHSSPNEPQRLAGILEILSAAGLRYYIKEAWVNLEHPFVSPKTGTFDLQLNIFGYR